MTDPLTITPTDITTDGDGNGGEVSPIPGPTPTSGHTQQQTVAGPDKQFRAARTRRPAALTIPLQILHPYRHRPGGRQCILCWGWIDDPRHNTREPAGDHP